MMVCISVCLGQPFWVTLAASDTQKAERSERSEYSHRLKAVASSYAIPCTSARPGVTSIKHITSHYFDLRLLALFAALSLLFVSQPVSEATIRCRINTETNQLSYKDHTEKFANIGKAHYLPGQLFTISICVFFYSK